MLDSLLIPKDILTKWADEAVEMGHSRQRLSKKIYEYLVANVAKDDIYEIAGKTYTPKQYSALIAGTALRISQTKATFESCCQYDNDLVQVSYDMSGCEICGRYSGRIFSLSGGHPTYPKLEKMPPFHIGCSCSMIGTSEEAIEIRKEYGETDMARMARKARERGMSIREYSALLLNDNEKGKGK